MSLSDYIPEKFIELFSDPDFSKAIKGYCKYLLKEDPEYRKEAKIFFDECLLTSDFKPIPRIAELETVTGLNDLSDIEEEEKEPSIPEQISLLNDKIESLSCASPEPINQLEHVVPETTLDLKTCEVVEHLKESVKPNEFGVFAIDKKTLDKFMTEEISEELRVKKVSRQLKKDIFKRAIELFSDIVYINTSPSGNKTKTLALKPSVKRIHTDAHTRLTGLGIWS